MKLHASNTQLEELIQELLNQMTSISETRRTQLDSLVEAIKTDISSFEKAKVMMICTHNSRRSQLGEIWINTLADYYKKTTIEAFSGGTEATAFHPNMVKALSLVGFEFQQITEEENPKYKLTSLNDEAYANLLFSKRFENKFNPQKNFIAVMVCSQADGGCPFVPGSSHRISLTYEDPKVYDKQPNAIEKYKAKIYEVGREMLYVFSKL
ncbi:low molecular weight phosphatase family protein [Mesonia aquimarina]|uniref:protein-tyrosine-phosphatase n=1 Tax=Mesonia aquimarina TaxID=1504967 RepID=UPI001F08AE83|nr:protein-tyrosine-phosphatase [Mesonia aquimarina]